MSRKANPTVIGAFIVGALALLVVGALLLAPDLGEDRENYMLYFEGSVKGLDVGAPVLIKGVRVGRVRDISLHMHTNRGMQHADYIVPVTVELSRRRLFTAEQTENVDVGSLIDKGLRAQLELDSFVTQKLFVELGFQPGTDATFFSPQTAGIKEIPTVQTGWQELQAGLSEIDIVHLMEQATSALEGVNRVLNGPDTAHILTSLAELMEGLNQDRLVLGESLELTLAEARGTFAEARTALTDMQGLLQSGSALSEDSRLLVQQLEVTLSHAEQITQNLDQLTREGSPTVYRAELALDEISGAARAMRRFLDMLEDRPEALLRGR